MDTLYINNHILADPDWSSFCIWTAKVGTTPLTAYWASSTFGLISVQKNPDFLVLNREKTFEIIIAEKISEINNIQNLLIKWDKIIHRIVRNSRNATKNKQMTLK
jgi:hypothetical protein